MQINYPISRNPWDVIFPAPVQFWCSNYSSTSYYWCQTEPGAGGYGYDWDLCSISADRSHYNQDCLSECSKDGNTKYNWCSVKPVGYVPNWGYCTPKTLIDLVNQGVDESRLIKSRNGFYVKTAKVTEVDIEFSGRSATLIHLIRYKKTPELQTRTCGTFSSAASPLSSSAGWLQSW